jgi:V/A-type H+/Na+-transporting ATPase subunit E
MEKNLEALIEKIRREGIDQARGEADKVEHIAREKAGKIIADAKERAGEILQKTEEECKRMKQALFDELELAARDLTLSVEQRILQMFRNVLEEKLSNTLSKNPVAFIRTVFDKWQPSVQGWRIYLSEQDLRYITEDLLDSLRKKAGEGLEVQIDHEIKAGFKVMIEDGSYYLDFTAGTMTELLMERLTPALRNILRKAKETGEINES